MAESTRVTEIISTWGNSSEGFGWTKNDSRISKNVLPSGIGYLSPNQAIQFDKKTNIYNKSTGENVQIVGAYIQTGRIVWIGEEYALVKDDNESFYKMQNASDSDFTVNNRITYTIESLDEDITIDQENVLSSLGVESDELLIDSEVVQPKKYVYEKNTSNQKTIYGKILKWDTERNFGFILVDSQDDNTYFNNKNFQNGVTSLDVGQEVKFKQDQNNKAKGFYVIDKIEVVATSDENSLDTSKKYEGICTKWDQAKKFGFISSNDIDKGVFVHISRLPDGQTDLLLGQHVSFMIEITNQGISIKDELELVSTPYELTKQHMNPSTFKKEPKTSNKITGIVTKWFQDKKYGFINISDGNPDIYVHCTNFEPTLTELNEGQQVKFIKCSNEKRSGFCAKNVSLVSSSGASPSGASPSTIFEGICIKWNHSKNFGVIRKNNSSETYYIDGDELESCSQLTKNQELTFKTRVSSAGKQEAFNVKI